MVDLLREPTLLPAPLFYSPVSRPVARSRRCALVVEHDRWYRDLLGAVLEEAGYAVAEASNGYTAWRLAMASPPDLAVVDLLLPELSGMALLRELRSDQRTRAAAVVAVTRAGAAGEAGLADATLCQPFASADARAAVARAVARRALVDAPTIVPIGGRFTRGLRTATHRSTSRAYRHGISLPGGPGPKGG